MTMNIRQTTAKGEGITRRSMLKGAAAAMATISIVPRHVLGGPGNRAPSETPVVAGIGIGGVGHGQIQFCDKAGFHVGVLCDIDDVYADHTYKKYPQARRYRDFREMIRDGIIGDVTEVHIWSNRPIEIIWRYSPAIPRLSISGRLRCDSSSPAVRRSVSKRTSSRSTALRASGGHNGTTWIARTGLVASIEGKEPVRISALTVHGHPDAIYRVLENGIVLANPSGHRYTFHLTRIAPSQRFRRLNGSSRQDSKTNNGQPVGETVTLGPRDGLFLVKTQ
ncbi:MAG: hypothetical protein ACC628_08255 [Pirellulaceae bacterium]